LIISHSWATRGTAGNKKTICQKLYPEGSPVITPSRNPNRYEKKIPKIRKKLVHAPVKVSI